MRGTAGLLAFGVLAFTAPRAEAIVQCPDRRGIYVPVSGQPHELKFTGSTGTLTLRNGRARLTYAFALTHSNGFARTHIVVNGKDAPSSVVSGYNPDFTGYRGDGSASYLILPDLSVSFYYWEPFRSRPNA
ncbi:MULTISPECIES: hypothetical protein [unclassified Methylobacterium]